MAFNPTLPATNTPLASAEMRAQLTALNTDIQTRATYVALNSAIAGSSANTNSVGTLGMSADSSYNQSQFQDIINKLDELINAARR